MNTLSVVQNKFIQTVSLKRPDVHNAFNAEMISELTLVFQKVALDKNTRAVILKGEGKSFCAGGDLNWMKSMASYTLQENLEDSGKLFEMYEAIAQCPVPILGRVHGSAFGGGLGLVAVCDIVAGVSGVKFCFSETKLGLVPAVISPFVLRKVSPSRVRPLMMTAEIFDDSRALELGLLHFVGTDEEVDDFLQSKVEFLVNNGPEAVRATKTLLNAEEDMSWLEIKKETTRVISERRVSSEGQEGMKAFFEKRKPNWKS